MPMSHSRDSRDRSGRGTSCSRRRNFVILAAALLMLVGGISHAAGGHPSAAAVLLVVGYCVLFPIGIASVAGVGSSRHTPCVGA